MRILQIIDSLNAGGAERMAVNYANALAYKIEFSGIVVTRKEGILKNQLNDKVSCYFIDKRKTFDFVSLKRLKSIIQENRIDILHAHGTSFFTAILVKLICFRVKVIFHEHNGDRSDQSFLKNLPLFVCVPFFERILVVNKQIENWFHQIGIKKAVYFPNFASFEPVDFDKTELKGQKSKRIICLANLRKPKNHTVLLKAFAQLNLKDEGWSLHLVGKNYQDNYSKNIIKQTNELNISDSVYLYDVKSDIENILSQATIGVLCSTYEGFPVTLLEYGLVRLPVISSNVGYCSEVIKHEQTGLLFQSNNENDLMQQLFSLIKNESLRNQYAIALHQLVIDKYSQQGVIKELMCIYKEVNG